MNTNSAVKIALIKTPCTKLVPPANIILTLNCTGKSRNTIAEAAIAPVIWAQTRKMARRMEMAPTRTVECYSMIEDPPEMRKKIQTLTIREKPKIMPM